MRNGMSRGAMALGAVVAGMLAFPAGVSAGTRQGPGPASGDDDDDAIVAMPSQAPVVETAPPVAAADPEGAVLFHWPVSEARSGRKDLALSARWQGGWHGRSLVLHWRRGDKGPWNQAAFVVQRDVLEARIPAGDVREPGLAYWIESIEADGRSLARFASAQQPQRVRVVDEVKDRRQEDRLAGHGGHRFRAAAEFRHADFGRQYSGQRRSEDSYNQLRLGFTYRPLLDGLYQVEGGLLMVGDRLGYRTLDPQAYGRPGGYLAYVKFYWEFGDVFGIEPLLILGATHDGIAPGGGLLLRIGALRTTHLDLAIKGARTLGWSFTTELDVLAASFLRIRVANELTNWPTNPGPIDEDDDGIAPYGILPSIGLAFLLPWGIEISGSIGYGIRKGYDRGWIHGTAGLAVEF